MADNDEWTDFRETLLAGVEDVLYAFAHWLTDKGYVEPQVLDAREAVQEFMKRESN